MNELLADILGDELANPIIETISMDLVGNKTVEPGSTVVVQAGGTTIACVVAECKYNTEYNRTYFTLHKKEVQP